MSQPPIDCPSCRWSGVAIADDGETPLLLCYRYPPRLYVQRAVLRQGNPLAAAPCGEWTPDEEIKTTPVPLPAGRVPAFPAATPPEPAQPRLNLVVTDDPWRAYRAAWGRLRARLRR